VDPLKPASVLTEAEAMPRPGTVAETLDSETTLPDATSALGATVIQALLFPVQAALELLANGVAPVKGGFFTIADEASANGEVRTSSATIATSIPDTASVLRDLARCVIFAGARLLGPVR
jgi:hypothetical protein